MDRQERVDLILDHFEHPHHLGVLIDAKVSCQRLNPGCGDRVKVYLSADDAGHLTGITFEGEGCVISQAAASMVMDLFQGGTLDDVELATADQVFELVGRDLAVTRPRCVTLALDTAKDAARSMRLAHISPVEDETIEPS